MLRWEKKEERVKRSGGGGGGWTGEDWLAR